MRHLCFFLLPLVTFVIGCGTDNEPQTPTITIPDLTTIQEARLSQLGKRVHVAGIVTVVPGTFASSMGDAGFAIQDETGGIYVSAPELLDLPFNAKVDVVGDRLEVASQAVLLSNFTGIERIIGEDQAVVPKVVKTGEVNESTEGQLVRITGTVSKAVESEKPYGFKAFVDDGSGEVRVYVNISKDEPLIDTAALVPGANVEITGLSSQFDDRYEVVPRRSADLVVQ